MACQIICFACSNQTQSFQTKKSRGLIFCDDFAQRHYTQVMRMKIKLLLFYWFDKEIK
jgi:hypothetical protein